MCRRLATSLMDCKINDYGIYHGRILLWLARRLGDVLRRGIQGVLYWSKRRGILPKFEEALTSHCPYVPVADSSASAWV